MGLDLMGKLNSYGLMQVSRGIGELERMIQRGDARPSQRQKQHEILRYLAASTNVLVQGRDDGFVNNIRGLQHIRFLGMEEGELALSIYDDPDPPNDLQALANLLRVFAERLPQYKENLKC